MIPNPKKINHTHIEFGNERIDKYFWMNQRDSKEVIDHLHSENAYCDDVMKPYKQLEDEMYEEIVAKIIDVDVSVPYTYKSFEYFYVYENGKEYPRYFRTDENGEQLLLDVNDKAGDNEFFQVSGRNISPDEKLYAYGVDTQGRRLYNIIIKNLETGEEFDDNLTHTSGWVTWRNDNTSFYYAKQDEETLRDCAIYLHIIGEPQEKDTLIYFEDDEEFTCSVFKSRDENMIFIKSESTLSTEYQYTDNSGINGFQVDNSHFKKVVKRENDHEYHLDYYNGTFYMLTNRDAFNFKLITFTIDNPKEYKELVAHDETVLIEDFDIFENFIVLNQRMEGNLVLKVISLHDHSSYIVDQVDEAYTTELFINPTAETSLCRYTYTSLTTPEMVIEFDMTKKDKRVLKEQEVKGDFNKDNYLSKRIFAVSHDGVEVPISLVYHKDTDITVPCPTLTYGYGSYGISSDPYFSIPRLSLLDRGFIYAIIHIRGGEENGRLWYENGKLSHKMNTFLDYIAGSKKLIEMGYTDSSKIFAYGGSAGGLLMGAIVNLEPELYKGILAAVPFVDVVTTMLDDSIPLTTGEYNEWGNPNVEADYNTMLTYSPYDNVKTCNFPNILVTTGYHDSQVQYWEPAKWVAKMRDFNTGKNRILFKTDMNAGHSGASGRYGRYREVAFDYSFLLSLV